MDEKVVINNVELPIEICEMVTEDVGKIVTIDRNRLAELRSAYSDDADDPQLPVLRVQAGLSGNGNNWPDRILYDVAEQINKGEKPGYWGHIAPDRMGYEFPDVETIWLGATVKTEGGKPTLYVKGYNIPGGKARKHAKAGLAKMTSWAGKATAKVVSGVRHIESFQLASIDWARPGSNGMHAAIAGYATEMEGSENEVDFSKVTLADIERENPSLFALMKQQVEADMQTTVTEMKEKADKADEQETIFDRLRALLGIGEDEDVVEAVTKVSAQVDQINQGALKERVLSALTKSVKGDSEKVQAVRSSLLRLFPVTEMVGKTDDEIDAAVGSFLTSDGDAQVIVTEMVTAPGPLSASRLGKPAAAENKAGRSGMVTVGSTKL